MNVTFVEEIKDKVNRLSLSLNRLKLQESYAGLVLGAIVVIVLGLLVANYFSRGTGQIGTAATISQQPAEINTARQYKVAAGDSLSVISEKYYGSQEYWPVLAQINKLSNPDIVYADTNLSIPTKSEVEKAKAEMAATNYDVQAGDTLFVISEKMYGDGSRWQLIASANRVSYLPNGNPLIFAGSTLVIPR